MTDQTPRTGLLSVIIPAYQEQDTLPAAVSAISKTLDDAQIACELLFIDDGSRDGTWGAVQSAAADDPRVRGIRFSRNFGKEAAIFAGLANAAGDCCAVIDCDLQHPPEKLVEMYRLWQEGYQVIEGVKRDRGRERPLHAFAARRFYAAMSRAAGVDMARASDFKLLDRRAVDVLVAMREKNTFFRALSAWVGFRAASVEYEVRPRAAGRSKWPLRSLIRYAMTSIAAFSSAPLQIVTILGVIVLICSVVLGIQSLWKKLAGQALEGFTTVILLILFIGSVLMICLGIIGYYIAKIYEEIKARPRYIVSESCGRPLGGGERIYKSE